MPSDDENYLNMVEHWRKQLRAWAESCALVYAKRPGVLGVAIGGNLARGQEWRHSDLELGLLVEERDQLLPYFNIDSGRGVEVIQLARSELAEQVRQVEHGDPAPILDWPIQLWRCRIVHDSSGLLAYFKRQFDDSLFTSAILARKVGMHRQKVVQALDEARQLLGTDRPAAALVRARGAVNEAILAFYWAHGELPRSQNRTDSRLRLMCHKHRAMSFYALYRDVFALDDATRVVRATWSKVRTEVLQITRLLGDTARDFFAYAVDGDFHWRQNAGILTVYRLYIPIIGAPARGVFEKIDDCEWAARHVDLMRFLGLDNVDPGAVSVLIERIAASVTAI